MRTLAVEVISGPDSGVRAEADSELMSIGTANGNVLMLTDPTVSRFHLELARALKFLPPKRIINGRYT